MIIQLVIHTKFGGFSLTQEMVRRLRDRGVSWATEICNPSGRLSAPSYVQNDEDIRQDPDLVAVVRELTEEFKVKSTGMTYRDREDLERELLGGLEVKSVTVDVTIEDYHDGKERVIVSGLSQSGPRW